MLLLLLLLLLLVTRNKAKNNLFLVRGVAAYTPQPAAVYILYIYIYIYIYLCLLPIGIWGIISSSCSSYSTCHCPSSVIGQRHFGYLHNKGRNGL